jgi:putative oxidoreductase
MNDSIKSPLLLAGRFLLALMFVMSGFGKLTNADGTAQFMASGGLPNMPSLALLVGLFEVVAGIALIVGFKTRWAALALAIFTAAASLMFHAYWSMPADQQYMQQLMFMKNVAVVGGMLAVAAFGAGAWSVDAARGRA